jgi:hypothetical protein
MQHFDAVQGEGQPYNIICDPVAIRDVRKADGAEQTQRDEIMRVELQLHQ